MPTFEVSSHHEEMAGVIDGLVESLEKGEPRRIIVSAPPRHTKSEFFSRRAPTYFMGRNPDKQIINVTYSSEFAQDFGRDVRNIMDTAEYRALFPESKLREDSRAANRMNTEQGGVYVSVGVGGPVTGRGAHLAIIDDPFKNRDDADSELMRDRVWKWYTSTLYTRLMPGGSILLVMTRWHEDDLAGRLLAQGGWELVNFAPEVKNGKVVKAVWPDWYPVETLQSIKDSIGSRDWNALYLQNPVPDEGTFFRKDWFLSADPPEYMNYYIATDFAVSADGGDYTELGVFGMDQDENLWVVDWWSGQESADVWVDALLDLVKKWSPLCVFGETGVIRRSIEPYLLTRMKERRVYSRIEWVTRNKRKAEMARPFQALAAQGKIKIGAQVDGLVDQLIQFPAGKHDDKVDACALMGLALQESHPAVLAKPKVVELDIWGRRKKAASWKLL